MLYKAKTIIGIILLMSLIASPIYIAISPDKSIINKLYIIGTIISIVVFWTAKHGFKSGFITGIHITFFSAICSYILMSQVITSTNYLFIIFVGILLVIVIKNNTYLIIIILSFLLLIYLFDVFKHNKIAFLFFASSIILTKALYLYQKIILDEFDKVIQSLRGISKPLVSLVFLSAAIVIVFSFIYMSLYIHLPENSYENLDKEISAPYITFIYYSLLVFLNNGAPYLPNHWGIKLAISTELIFSFFLFAFYINLIFRNLK